MPDPRQEQMVRTECAKLARYMLTDLQDDDTYYTAQAVERLTPELTDVLWDAADEFLHRPQRAGLRHLTHMP